MLKNISVYVVKMGLSFSYMWDKLWIPFYKRCMKHCGRGIYLRPTCSDFKGLWNISIGDYTSIPKRSTFYFTEASLTIGNRVVFGPNPTIITGDYRIDVILLHEKKLYEERLRLTSDVLQSLYTSFEN